MTKTSTKADQKALFDWIDEAENHTINGQSIPDLFSIAGYSYWWYVRARIFYTLFRASHQGATSNPTTTSNTETKQQKAAFRFPSFSHLRQVQRALNGKLGNFDAVVHSNIFYNEVKDGKVRDKALHALMNVAENVLRYELLPLPPKGVSNTHFEMRKLPQTQPTVTLDSILIHYLLRHPFELARAFFRWKMLRKRFGGTFDHSFIFSENNETWQNLLQNTMQKTVTSLVICDLVRKANVWFLGKIKPQFVIGTSENNSLGRAFFEAAKAQHIPTLGIQHGSIDPHNVDYRFRGNTARNAINLPTAFLAWGNETRDYLVQQSHYAPETTFAVGRLLADEIGQPIPDVALKAFKERRKKPSLLFASQAQGMFDEYRVAVAPLLAQFCAENGLCCIVKPHPREVDDGIYRTAFSEYGILDDLMEAQGELYAFIAAADFGATCYSTVAWEMLWQRKPLIVFDPFHLDLMKVRTQSFIFFPDPNASFDAWKQDLPRHLEAGSLAAEQKLGAADGKTLFRILQIVENVSR